jgi:5-(carboxyamino)imidazole ribonucleotide synthase
MPPAHEPVIEPGAAIGILGGGQLGRMTALAARAMGYRVNVLDPDPACPAAPLCDRVFAGGFDDVAAGRALALDSDVVTLEIEQIAPAVLDAVAAIAPLRPGAFVVATVQDRVRQKRWLEAHGFPIAAWREAQDEASFVAAWRDIGGRVFAKSAFGGFDGRGQARADGGPDAMGDAAARAAYATLPPGLLVVERALSLDAELSVLVARGANGEVAVYPSARNHHERQALAWSVLPGEFEPRVESRAAELAEEIALELGVIGLLCVEFFLTTQGELLVNELAPRPHNSYHGSSAALGTGQFEQLVRAVTGLPLGGVQLVSRAAIANLFGDLWVDGLAPAWERALAVRGVSLHLYGKRVPRPGRKMGHLLALGTERDEVLDRVCEALEALRENARNSF